MKIRFHLFVLTLVSLFLISQTAMASSATESAGLPDYPRIEHFNEGSVQVDFPTLESWPDFRFLKVWLPVEVKLNGDTNRRVGSVYIQALTEIDFEQRTVRVSEQKVLDIKFPGDEGTQVVKQLTSQAFRGRERIVPLDVLLRLLPEDFEIPGQTAATRLNFDPPVIRVSDSPLQLLSIDKEPVRAPIEGTELEYVVNTNWNVFYSTQDGRWYVLNDRTWQVNNFLADGGWTDTDKLPGDFDRLALSDNWKEIQQSMPPSIPAKSPIPFAVSLQATELVLLDGEPQLKPIKETEIRYVSNTESDLFIYDGHWYFLVSGRWFSSSELNGRWQSVTDLPDAFAAIPSDHKKGHVLFSVPGTRQAKLSLIEAALPHRVSVTTGAASKLEVNWVGDPRFVPIENTRLQRGLNTPHQIIKHNNYYYLCIEGAWLFSDSAIGPWKLATQIPDEIYRIPASDPAYNVTFVKIGKDQPETREYINFDYSAGYTGSFSTKISVVYGTGWHYPSSVFWDPMNNPYYWGFPSTYGYNIGYHPVGAFYGGRMGYRGGYGGWGGYGGYGGWGGYPSYSSITIESATVDFTQGYGSAWEGPLQTTPGDPSETEERSLDKFLPKKKETGTEEFIDTSKDGVAKPAAISASSLYAGSASISSSRYSGPDGEVYQREGQQWSQYSEGNWNTMHSLEQEYRTPSRPQPKPESQQYQRYVPAHKKTLSRAELDRQELARLEGMDNYAKYRMDKDSEKQ